MNKVLKHLFLGKFIKNIDYEIETALKLLSTLSSESSRLSSYHSGKGHQKSSLDWQETEKFSQKIAKCLLRIKYYLN